MKYLHVKYSPLPEGLSEYPSYVNIIYILQDIQLYIHMIYIYIYIYIYTYICVYI